MPGKGLRLLLVALVVGYLLGDSEELLLGFTTDDVGATDRLFCLLRELRKTVVSTPLGKQNAGKIFESTSERAFVNSINLGSKYSVRMVPSVPCFVSEFNDFLLALSTRFSISSLLGPVTNIESAILAKWLGPGVESLINAAPNSELES